MSIATRRLSKVNFAPPTLFVAGDDWHGGCVECLRKRSSVSVGSAWRAVEHSARKMATTASLCADVKG
jgi:hypothetical protein